FARKLLDVEQARIVGLESVPRALRPAEIEAGMAAEVGRCHPLRAVLGMPDLHFVIPIRIDREIESVLAVSPGIGRRALVSDEVSFLANAAAQYGHRMNWLRRDRESSER